MKTGRTLTELAQEIERRANAKADYVAPTNALAVYNDPERGLRLSMGDSATNPVNTGIKELAHGQIASHTGIPMAYYRKMVNEAPELLATNVGEWFKRYPKTRMIRTLDGDTRAFLSDRYRALENEDLAEAALPVLLNENLLIRSCEITDRRLYIKAVSQSIERDVPTGATYGRGHTIYDTVSPAITISNSEVGSGSLSVEACVYTKACTNMMTFGQRALKKYHVGGKHELGDDVFRMLSDETRKATDKALWMQLADVVRGAFDEVKFDGSLDVLRAASTNPIEADPAKVVTKLQKAKRLNEDEGSSILQHLIKGGDLTQYGLHSAVTRAAEDHDDYDRATEFERLGGQIIEMPRSEWRELVAA